MFIQMLPLITIFIIGVVCRSTNALVIEDGRALSKLVIYITMPCLAFVSFSQAEYTTNEILILAFLGLAIPMILFLISLMVSTFLSLERRRLAVFLSSATVANLSFFLYPFFDIYYGKEGLVKLIMFDVGNTISAYTLAYFIVLRYSANQRHSVFLDIHNLLKFPPLWGVTLGIIYGLTSKKLLFMLPDYLLDTVSRIGQSNSLIAMIVLGIFFNLRVKYTRELFWAVFIRMACGMAIGSLFAWALNLEGLVKFVVILAPGMPVGLSIIVYSIQQELDSDFAISILSVSLILGLFILFFFSL